jgi:16S rRNA (cytidine1402-2'-O)-methyltransferase
LSDLEEGKHIALVSDAGTPGVSDPGVFLVKRARAAGALIDAIPGASALTTAFSIAGIAGNEFTFLGFVPQKKGRETFFKSLAEYDHPVMFYESVHRIMKTLTALVDHFGNENNTINRTITVARELTKMHEEIVQGSPEEVLAYFTNNPDKVRGEFVVMVV